MRMPGEGVRMFLPVLASQRRTVLSQLPLAIVFASGANATLVTESVCPVSVRMFLPVLASQSRIVSSQLPEAIVFA